MKIKAFYGDTVREALERVKRELGPNAMILSTKQVKARPALGLKGAMVYEIAAALDWEADAAMDAMEPSESTASPDARPARADNRENAHTAVAGEAERVSPALRRELDHLRRLIYSMASPLPPRVPASDDPSHEAYCDLLANDVDETLARRIIDDACARLAGHPHATRPDWSEMVQQLVCEMIDVAPLDDERRRSGAGDERLIAAFIGPTGVGKTTTIAKLAARYALELRRKVLLVTLDTYRIAAIDQLRTYAGIIGVPLEVISDIADLDRVLSQNLKKDVVLIDTVGCSPREAVRMKDLAGYLDNMSSVQKHLVLSATTKPIDLAEITEKFHIFGPSNLLFTKLDETSTFGPILNELVRSGKPLSYVTNGQKVPEDLSVPTAREVAHLIMPAHE